MIPPAGIDAHHGDWTGVWESYLVDDVVPWADANLATLDDGDGRVLAGLSAGGSVLSTSGFAIPGCSRHSRPGAATSGRCGRRARPCGRRRSARPRPEPARRPRGTPAAPPEDPVLPVVGNDSRPLDRGRDEGVLRRAEDAGRPHRLWLAAGGHDGQLWRAASRCSGVRLARAPRLPRVDFELTDEQRLIQDTVRAFVDERVCRSRTRTTSTTSSTGPDRGMAESASSAWSSPRSTAAPGSITCRRRSPARDRAGRGRLPDADLGPRRGSTRSRC